MALSAPWVPAPGGHCHAAHWRSGDPLNPQCCYVLNGDIPVIAVLCQLILAGSFVKRGTGRRTALELYAGTGSWAAAMRRHNSLLDV